MAIEDFKIGDRFASPSKTLTDAHFLFFSGLTGDNHPIHYDVEYAKQKGFRGPLAHGLLLASMTALGASPGSQIADGLVFVEQGCRFLRAAIPGDTIHPELLVDKIWQDGPREFVRLITRIQNQRDETLLEGFHVYQKVQPKVAGKTESK